MDEKTATMEFTKNEMTGLAASVHAHIFRLRVIGSPNGTPEEKAAAITTLEDLLSRLMIGLVEIKLGEEFDG